MTCPTCSKQLLFGSHECSCGWTPAAHGALAIDLSHREALAVFWRIGWTGALFVFSGMVFSVRFLAATMDSVRAVQLFNFIPFQWLLQNIWSAIAIFLFVPLMLRWPYRRFSLVVATDQGTARQLQFAQRLHVAAFVFWRTLAASLLVPLMLVPLNMFFGLMRVNLAAPVTLAVTVFVAGPLIIRLLIGHQFPGFRVDVERGS